MVRESNSHIDRKLLPSFRLEANTSTKNCLCISASSYTQIIDLMQVFHANPRSRGQTRGVF
jgi:hypothetical protein